MTGEVGGRGEKGRRARRCDDRVAEGKAGRQRKVAHTLDEKGRGSSSRGEDIQHDGSARVEGQERTMRERLQARANGRRREHGRQARDGEGVARCWTERRYSRSRREKRTGMTRVRQSASRVRREDVDEKGGMTQWERRRAGGG